MDGQRGGALIVGAGQAGVQVAASLRELGHDGPIALVGDEPRLPYQRPPLSKGLLLGRPDAVELRSEQYYADAAIELVRGDRVVDLALPAAFPDTVGTAVTASGRVIRFDQLALCLGGRPRTLDLPGADLSGVHYLRSLDDALSLRGQLRAGRSVVVVGGGFIGLETAAAAARVGCAVTVLESADRLLARAVHPAVSDHLVRAHGGNGVTVRLGATVAGFSGPDHRAGPTGMNGGHDGAHRGAGPDDHSADLTAHAGRSAGFAGAGRTRTDGGRAGRVGGVRLATGEVIPADVVVVGVGLLPSTGLARRAGLVCRAGVVVDERARTSRRGVVAAGDCTVGPGGFRLESVPNAVAQARQAAAVLLGRPAPATAVPWFWSDQGDLKLQIAGLSAGHDAAVVRGNPDDGSFAVVYYRGGQPIAVDAVNAPREFLAIRRLLDKGGVPLDRAA